MPLKTSGRSVVDVTLDIDEELPEDQRVTFAASVLSAGDVLRASGEYDRLDDFDGPEAIPIIKGMLDMLFCGWRGTPVEDKAFTADALLDMLTMGEVTELIGKAMEGVTPKDLGKSQPT